MSLRASAPNLAQACLSSDTGRPLYGQGGLQYSLGKIFLFTAFGFWREAIQDGWQSSGEVRSDSRTFIWYVSSAVLRQRRPKPHPRPR